MAFGKVSFDTVNKITIGWVSLILKVQSTLKSIIYFVFVGGGSFTMLFWLASDLDLPASASWGPGVKTCANHSQLKSVAFWAWQKFKYLDLLY